MIWYFFTPAIMLGSIKCPYAEVRRRILAVDEENLSELFIESLLKYMPEPGQMKQLAEFKDDYDSLAEPEQFAVTVSGECCLISLCNN